MTDFHMAREIESAALSCGYDSCGIIPVEKMEGFAKLMAERIKSVPSCSMFYAALDGFDETLKRFPWAGSVVVCVFNYGRYSFPEKLQGKYAKGYLLSPESNKKGSSYAGRQKFRQWFGNHGIRCAGGMEFGHGSIGPLRYAAQEAGLGIIRKNGFFYSKEGSYLELEGYVIDRRCELYHEHNLKPCPDGCELCLRACPTEALCAPYTMDPFRCLSYINTFGKGVLPLGIRETQAEEWVYGCEDCQDKCPFNRTHDWNTGEEIKELAEIADKMLPENIPDADDGFLKREIAARSFYHIGEDETETIRVCAARSVRNAGRE